MSCWHSRTPTPTWAMARGCSRWLDEVAWLGAPRGAAQITDADAAEARELRDSLIVVLLANARDPLTDQTRVEAAEALLRRAGDRYPSRSTSAADVHACRPAQPGLAGVFGELLASITTLSLSGEWPRRKACRNEPCRAARFVDRSRNTSAAYCRAQCSSQASMRAYRARRRLKARLPDQSARVQSEAGQVASMDPP